MIFFIKRDYDSFYSRKIIDDSIQENKLILLYKINTGTLTYFNTITSLYIYVYIINHKNCNSYPCVARVNTNI